MPESGVRRLRLLPCASVPVQNRRRANRVLLLLLSSQRESLRGLDGGASWSGLRMGQSPYRSSSPAMAPEGGTTSQPPGQPDGRRALHELPGLPHPTRG